MAAQQFENFQPPTGSSLPFFPEAHGFGQLPGSNELVKRGILPDLHLSGAGAEQGGERGAAHHARSHHQARHSGHHTRHDHHHGRHHEGGTGGRPNDARSAPSLEHPREQSFSPPKEQSPNQSFDLPFNPQATYDAAATRLDNQTDRTKFDSEIGGGKMDQAKLNQDFDRFSSMSRGGSGHMEQLPNGSVYFRSGMQVDADGSPDATRIDPYGSKNTSLRNPDNSSLNAHEVPYVALPAGKYQQYGIKPGDVAAVRYNGKVSFAVFGDVSPSHTLGEGSMALAQSLGINHSPTHGGVGRGVEYLVFPGSGHGNTSHSGFDSTRIGALRLSDFFG